jgi:repressor LexA
MSNSLTARQQELLNYLRSEHSSTGIMPSSREIQQHFGFASQTAAMDLLRALERKGVIQRLPGKARAVILTRSTEAESESADRYLADLQIARIPILGSIAAGMPQDTTGSESGCLTVDLDSLGIPKNARTFALKIRGDSMVDAHILSGDYVILEFREPRNGDIVAALIDGETTLKRYLVKNGQPYLKAENSKYPDLLPARELVVQGVMLALLRRSGRDAA